MQDTTRHGVAGSETQEAFFGHRGPCTPVATARLFSTLSSPRLSSGVEDRRSELAEARGRPLRVIAGCSSAGFGSALAAQRFDMCLRTIRQSFEVVSALNDGHESAAAE